MKLVAKYMSDDMQHSAEIYEVPSKAQFFTVYSNGESQEFYTLDEAEISAVDWTVGTVATKPKIIELDSVLLRPVLTLK
jgi:hypothetical protein